MITAVAPDRESPERQDTSVTRFDDRPPLPTVFRRQPWWAMPSLGAVLVVAAVLYTWNIGYSGLSTYYAASVKSMLENPRAVFFGALDPGATVTLDKLAGFLVPQAVSAKIFGFSAWSLSLPQVIEGLVTVVASYVIGARWRGPAVGLAIAAVMATTPMLAAMFGRPMEDGMLTMCMVLAFAAWQRSLLQRSVVWLCVSGVWIAVGFQAKMLQAWLLLPALLIAYLLSASVPLRRRIWHLALAGAVTLVLSLSWMTAIQLVPANDRPFVDGTTSNNTYSMVFGYNGVDRLIPNLVPGSVPQLNSSPGSGQSPANRTSTSAAGANDLKLLLPQFTTQMGWLYPSAILGTILELLAFRRSRIALGLILWALITGAVMSLAFVPHATYLAVITLPLSALAVAAWARTAEHYRARSPRWGLLPALAVAQTLWGASVALLAAPQLRWLAPVILVVGLPSAGALLWFHFRPPLRSSPTKGAFVGVLSAALIAPLIWSLCVLGPGGGGSASDAYAGPRMAASAPRSVSGSGPGRSGLHVRPPFSVPAVNGLDAQQRHLVAYVDAHNASGSIPFATDTMAIAVSVILFTGQGPMAMGGFSQHAPTPVLSELRRDISSRRLRFVLLADFGAGVAPPRNPAIASDREWVRAHCAPVLSGRFREGKSARQTLYDCAAVATVAGTAPRAAPVHFVALHL